jgi:CSLREA domain-containing protein
MIDNLQKDDLPVETASLVQRLLKEGTVKLLARLVPLVVCLGTIAVGHAATFTVNTTADEADANPADGICRTASGQCSLRAAIQTANATPNTTDLNGVLQPDVIDVPADTYTLSIAGAGEDQAATGDLDITDSVTISGPGPVLGSSDTLKSQNGCIATIDTSGTQTSQNVCSTISIDTTKLSDRIFHVINNDPNAVVTVNLNYLSIEDGHLDGGLGGGLYNNGGIVTISNSNISNNSVINATSGGASGGGVFNSGTLDLNHVTLKNNIVDLNNATSTGAGGGAVYNAGSLRVEDSVLDGNQILNDAGNSAGGGGIQNTGVTGLGPNATKTVIIGSTISNNSATLGGGVRNLFGRVDIDLTLIDSNSVTLSGGGVQNDSNGGMAISNSTIRNNSAPQSGGGVNNVATLDISNSSIYGNQSLGLSGGAAGGAGGGIFIGAAGALNLISTTVSGNQARAGGGIYNHKFLNATNATIYDNSVTGTSGGTEIFACGSGDTQTPSTCNQGITATNGSLLIKTDLVNTIVGNGSSTANCGGDVADLIISQGHNLETANSCGFAASGDITNAAPSAVFVDPATTGLTYNGGELTSLKSIAILSTGPALNAADFTSCPLTDERGFLRDSQCDIGAYEYNAENNPANGTKSVLDLAVSISDKLASPRNGTVQVTMTFTVVNKGSIQAHNVVLKGSIPALSWINITSLGSGSSAGSCVQTSTGFTCTIPTVDAYGSADFYAAVVVSQAGTFHVGADVLSKEADNYNPDNSASTAIEIPTVAGSSVSGNNFAGASGGGAMDWLSLLLLLPALVRRRGRSVPAG